MTKKQIEAIHIYISDRLSEDQNDEEWVNSTFESIKTIILFNRGVCSNLITDDGMSISLFKDECYPLVRRKWDDDEILFDETHEKVQHFIQNLPHNLSRITRERSISAYMYHVIVEEYLL